MHRSIKAALAIGIAGTMAFASAIPAKAGPLPTNTAALRDAAPTDVIDVRWRGRYHRHGGGALAAGLAFGLIGTALAAAAAPRYYDYGYPYGYYGGYAPAYYGYGYYPRPYYSPRRIYAGPRFYRPYRYYRPYGFYRRAYWRRW